MLNWLKKQFSKKQPYEISEVAQFMINCDQKNPIKSASQSNEINRQRRINYLRDHAVNADNNRKVWEGF